MAGKFRKMVLVVDDNVEFCQMLATILTEQGVDVTQEYTPGKALRRAQDVTFDIAIVDICLPEMDGFQLCRLLRSLPNPPIIYLITGGHIDASCSGLTAQFGAADIFQKPYDLKKLLSIVNLAAS